MQPKAEDYDEFVEFFEQLGMDWDFMFVSRIHEDGFYSTKTQHMFSIWWAGVEYGRSKS